MHYSRVEGRVRGMETHFGNRVLLVGLKDIADELKGKLLYRGFAFEEAATGEEALEKARVTKFQTIVLDVDVPGLDGIEVVRKLREWDSRVKIMLVAGLDRWDNCIDTLEIGLEEIILRPLGTRELLNLLGASTNL